jgi:transcription initiation factor TFIIIB Brf1 subunit/transcription initiation factor TFIIB
MPKPGEKPECPKCHSTHILSDYFEDEWLYWCGNCGTDVTVDVLYSQEEEEWISQNSEEAPKA